MATGDTTTAERNIPVRRLTPEQQFKASSTLSQNRTIDLNTIPQASLASQTPNSSEAENEFNQRTIQRNTRRNIGLNNSRIPSRENNNDRKKALEVARNNPQKKTGTQSISGRRKKQAQEEEEEAKFKKWNKWWYFPIINSLVISAWFFLSKVSPSVPHFGFRPPLVGRIGGKATQKQRDMTAGYILMGFIHSINFIIIGFILAALGIVFITTVFMSLFSSLENVASLVTS